jgi:phytanoyl-CoA hydroxylase
MAARLSRIHSHLAHTAASPAGAVAPPPAAPSRLPSPCSAEDVASFRADGYLLLPGLIPAVELAAVDRDSRALIERGLDGPFGDDRWNYGEDPAEPSAAPIPRRINGLADDDMPPSFQVLMAYPPLLAAAAALMADVNGESRAFCAGVPGALVYKVPRRGFPVAWHQDPVVIKRFPAFNVDVYLDDSDEDNACVWAIPGSHLGGYHSPADGEAQRHIASWTGGHEGKDVPGAVPVRARRGDVLVHATSVLHGSGWNRSDRMRRTVYYHFDSWEDVNLGGGYASRNDDEAAERTVQRNRPT